MRHASTPVGKVFAVTRDVHESSRAGRREATAELVEEMATATGRRRRLVENDLIAVNLEVAREVAARYRGRGIADEDLQQVASVGLVKAARGFDPAKATDFLSFAVPTIRGELRRHFRDLGWAVRPPRSVQEMQARITRAQGELWQRLGREPDAEQIAEHLGVDTDPVLEALGANGCFLPSSLDATSEGGESTPADRLASFEPGYTCAEARVALRPLLKGLTPRERRILELRFVEDRTQAEIGAEIGVTQMQVSRLLSSLYERLRTELTGTDPVAA
jgi:RNA polymerase sigma-B factor